VEAEAHAPRTAWRVVVSTIAFHVMRHFPRWAGLLPAHRPRVESVLPEAIAGEAPRPVDSPR